ncbi:peroxiredoxin [Spirillospora sp. CA-294931]|uniref:peroxiredoxin n=1 Tax=Spirillospora sp. CA-294931 TaxID=3240042 RepID=UPI003D8C067F
MKVGEVVEDFALPDETGETRTLGGLLEKGPVVLFFYPGAMTPVCTAEACHFRDVSAELAELGAHPVGISADAVGKQKEFSDKHGFGYPLLSDEDGRVRDAFGVKRGLALAPTKRQTFVIDTDRRVLAVIKSEVRANVHADRALEALRRRS